MGKARKRPGGEGSPKTQTIAKLYRCRWCSFRSADQSEAMLHNMSRHPGQVGRWCQSGKQEPVYKIQYMCLVTGTMVAVNGQVPQGFKPHKVNYHLPSVGSGPTSTVSKPPAAASAVSSTPPVSVVHSLSTVATAGLSPVVPVAHSLPTLATAGLSPAVPVVHSLPTIATASPPPAVSPVVPSVLPLSAPLGPINETVVTMVSAAAPPVAASVVPPTSAPVPSLMEVDTAQVAWEKVTSKRKAKPKVEAATPAPPPARITCEQCKATFPPTKDGEVSLQRHRQAVHDEKQAAFVCNQCCCHFTTVEALTGHFADIHGVTGQVPQNQVSVFLKSFTMLPFCRSCKYMHSKLFSSNLGCWCKGCKPSSGQARDFRNRFWANSQAARNVEYSRQRKSHVGATCKGAGHPFVKPVDTTQVSYAAATSEAAATVSIEVPFTSSATSQPVIPIAGAQVVVTTASSPVVSTAGTVVSSTIVGEVSTTPAASASPKPSSEVPAICSDLAAISVTSPKVAAEATWGDRMELFPTPPVRMAGPVDNESPMDTVESGGIVYHPTPTSVQTDDELLRSPVPSTTKSPPKVKRSLKKKKDKEKR